MEGTPGISTRRCSIPVRMENVSHKIKFPAFGVLACAALALTLAGLTGCSKQRAGLAVKKATQNISELTTR